MSFNAKHEIMQGCTKAEMKARGAELEAQGHACQSYVGEMIGQLKMYWCGREDRICKEVEQQDDMARRQREDDILYERLKSEGHTCLERYRYPSDTDWCQMTPCIKSYPKEERDRIYAEQQARQDKEFIQKLNDEGHTCVVLREDGTAVEKWCLNIPCNGEPKTVNEYSMITYVMPK